MESTGRLGDVILHEMGHVLGISAQLWSPLGLLVDPSPTSGAPQDTHFNGANAIAGFDAIGGTTYSGGQKVPVENTGGAGTVNSHWREAVLQNELMTGFINNGANPLSQLTVRSLIDLGYSVNVSAADPLFLSISARGPETAVDAPLHLVNDIWTGPAYAIDRAGRRVRVR